MIKRISNISEEAKFWFVASFFSLTIIAFVITTPGDRNVATSMTGLTSAYSADQSEAVYDETPIHPLQSFEYGYAEEVAFKTKFDQQIRDY